MKSENLVHIGTGYAEWKRKVNLEYDKVTIVFEHHWEDDEGRTHSHVKLRVTPYHPEDQFERDVYGDAEWDEYTMSDSYREDCRSEQWDWLKNA